MHLKRQEESEKAIKDGVPYLVNLNEDPMLDRKVKYQISVEKPLTCGRRTRNS
jgi:hypothetical protein